MADFTHRVGSVYTSDAGTVSSVTTAYTGNDEVNEGDSITASTSNKHFVAYVDVSQIQCMLLKSDKDIEVYTNAASTGSPTDHISLKAGIPVIWTKDNLDDCPFTADITLGVYVTNTGASAAHFQMRVLQQV